MLLLAVLGCRAPGPWLRGAGRCQALLLLDRRPVAWYTPDSGLASAFRPEGRPVWRETARPFSGTPGSKQVLFPHVAPLRCFSTVPFQENSEYGRLVYCGNLTKMIHCVKFFSYSTSMLNICLLPFIISRTETGTHSLPLEILFYSTIGFFTFLTPITIHLVTKGYVIRLYHKAETDTYTAFTSSAILIEKKTVFQQKDVKIPAISKIFTTFYARTKSLFVNPDFFQYSQDYNHLMGYDKPFTFDLEESKESTEEKQNSKVSDA